MDKKKKKPLHKQKTRQYRFRGCPVGLSPSQRKRLVAQMLFKMQDGMCFYCKSKMKLPTTNQKKIKGLCATIDHIVPVSKGGMSDLDNVVLACAECNFRRGGRWTNPVTRRGISLPLEFGHRWDFLTEEDKDVDVLNMKNEEAGETINRPSAKERFDAFTEICKRLEKCLFDFREHANEMVMGLTKIKGRSLLIKD